MSNTPKPSGGPAFPNGGVIKLSHEGVAGQAAPPEEGMSLRDYFAAKAMQATIMYWMNYKDCQTPFDDCAEEAYSLADKMLEARKL